MRTSGISLPRDPVLSSENPKGSAVRKVGGTPGAVGARLQVGDIALDPGQCPGLGFQLPVDGVGALAELDEPVPLDWRPSRDGVFGFGDLLVDAAQCAAGAVVPVLVVDDLVTAAAVGPGGPGLGEDVPVGDVLAGVAAVPPGDDVGDLGDAQAEDE